MNEKKYQNDIHIMLFDNWKIKEVVKADLDRLVKKRANIHERNRKELETNIGRKQELLKIIESHDQHIRDMFNYL